MQFLRQRWLGHLVLAWMCAYSPAQAQIPKFTARAELVTVPVVATRSGHHVSGLKKEDFTVYEDGKEQAISFFEEIKASTRPLRRLKPPEGTYTNEISTGEAPATLTIIVLDTLNTPALIQENARREVVKFLSGSLQENQPVMLVMLRRSGLKVVHDFTTDPAVLVKALAKVKTSMEGNNVGPAELAADAEIHGQDDISLRTDVTTEGLALTDFLGNKEATVGSMVMMQTIARIESTLESMQELARGLGAMPGRKSMIWVTGGMPYTSRETRIVELYNQTWHAISAANIAVYPVDLVVENPTLASAERRGPTRISRGIDSQLVLRSFADYTGGTVCSFRSDLDTCFKKAVEDSSEYYMLSYYAKPLEKSGWRKLQVKTRAERVHLRSRNGYLSLGSDVSPEDTRKTDVALAIVSPVEYTGLGVMVRWTGVVSGGEKRKLSFEVKIPPHEVTIDTAEDNHMKLNFVVVAQDASGKVVAATSQDVDAHLKPENLEKVQTAGVRYAGTLEIPSGDYKVRFIVRDALSGKMGTVKAPSAPLKN
ncbi:MAG: VWA domain-containing protein [Terriglobales bacterium]